MSDISFCRYDWKHERGDWVVEINKDTDGHLNLYITNIKSDSLYDCLLYTSPSPRDRQKSRMPSSA